MVLRKFNLQDCTLDNLLWNVFWMMRALTVNIDSRLKYRPSIVHYTFAALCFCCYIYTYTFCMFYNLGWVYPVTKDVTSAIIIVALGFSSSIATMKLVGVFILKERLVNLVDRYRKINEEIDPRTRFAINAKHQLRIVKRRALIFYTSFTTTSFIYLMFPAIMPGKNFPENSLRMYGLEPMFESPNYEIAYTCNMLAGIMATTVPVHVTVLLIILTGYVEAHVTALAQELACLWTDTTQQLQLEHHPSNAISYLHQPLNAVIKPKLESLVRNHGEFVQLLSELKSMFKIIIALEFVLTMIAMCGVMLGGLEDTYLQIPYTVIQLFFDSVIGQRLIDSSKLFEKAVYNCGWENFDASNMKTVQIVLQCAQRELSLSAGDVTNLSFESCMAIVKSVYSAYATLTRAMK